MSEKFLKTKEVCAMLRISRPTLHKWVRRGQFPMRVALSERTVAFRASEVEAWIEGRVADRERGAEERRARSEAALAAKKVAA